MSNCKNICRLCDKLIISTATTFTAGTGLIITIPAGSYSNNCKYCIVVAQSIPATTTINAPVFIRIGAGPVLYPVTRCDCVQLTACGIKTRTKYSMVVHTTADSGTFRILGNVCCQTNTLRAINGDGALVEAEGEVN